MPAAPSAVGVKPRQDGKTACLADRTFDPPPSIGLARLRRSVLFTPGAQATSSTHTAPAPYSTPSIPPAAPSAPETTSRSDTAQQRTLGATADASRRPAPMGQADRTASAPRQNHSLEGVPVRLGVQTSSLAGQPCLPRSREVRGTWVSCRQVCQKSFQSKELRTMNLSRPIGVCELLDAMRHHTRTTTRAAACPVNDWFRASTAGCWTGRGTCRTTSIGQSGAGFSQFRVGGV